MVDEKDDNVSWSFPDINSQQNHAIHFSSLVIDGALKKNESNPQEEINKLQAELNKLRIEYNMLRQESDKIEAISTSIVTKLQESSSYLDEDIVDTLKVIIKSICEKIIKREFAQDDKLIGETITTLQQSIDSHGGAVSIFVCEKDFVNLQDAKHPLMAVVKVDKLLNVGDVIIHSNINEIRSVINESIQNLME